MPWSKSGVRWENFKEITCDECGNFAMTVHVGKPEPEHGGAYLCERCLKSLCINLQVEKERIDYQGD